MLKQILKKQIFLTLNRTDKIVLTRKLYKKTNDKLLYIHSSSSHLPQMIKELPNSISERLWKNSSNQGIFITAKIQEEDTAKRSRYNVDLKCTYKNLGKPKTQKRNIIWFNPPFNKSVSTNVSKTFIQLVTKRFPRSHKFHKIFNRKTVKVSYSCMNMPKIIKEHNKKVKWNPCDQWSKCNCRKKAECPIEGNFQVNDLVWKCDLARTLPKKVYLELAEEEWKSPFFNHKLSFKHKWHLKNTILSSYMWHLKSVSSETPNLN